MKKRKLGLHGPRLSVIGFGAWAVGGPWKWGWGDTDEKEAERAIRCAIDLGVNWIDTAPVYGLGRSEHIVGRAIKGCRDKIYLATKCGLRWRDNGDIYNDISPQSIRHEVEESLRRLKVDVIDLYQIHWPSANQSEGRALRELQRLQKEGKIRWIGVSNFDIKLLRQSVKNNHIDALQPPFNLFQREAKNELLPFCADHGIGVVAYSPMYSGLLSGRFERSNLAADDWRSRHPMFNEPRLEKNLRFVEELRPIAESCQATVGQLSLAWVLRHPAVTSAIVGARTEEQVKENVRAANCVVTDQQMQQIDRICEKYQIRDDG